LALCAAVVKIFRFQKTHSVIPPQEFVVQRGRGWRRRREVHRGWRREVMTGHSKKSRRRRSWW
jgi:hypothetical protein